MSLKSHFKQRVTYKILTEIVASGIKKIQEAVRICNEGTRLLLCKNLNAD